MRRKGSVIRDVVIRDVSKLRFGQAVAPRPCGASTEQRRMRRPGAGYFR
jgi:hypothetical protein